MNSRFRSWPITEARALEPALKEMGLRVPASRIDGTAPDANGQCLSDALVSVGSAGRGGTGSFVSADGLILTNHHVALDAVRQASTSEHDYLRNGFVARSRAGELRGPDYEAWITRSCEDVSSQIVPQVAAEQDALVRANRVRDLRQDIARAREAAHEEAHGAAAAAAFRCDVQEMWPGRSYVLFTYERLRDVRIVYVPPFSLGCFGGDTDNFEWPRHTADFTLLRAYVAPDGSAAEPHADNVPYRPTAHFRASRVGVAPGDFVFLLGFPGRTMRYAPACRLAYSDTTAVPELLRDFGAKLSLIREHAAASRGDAIKLTSARKGLANEHKRSGGKRLMMKRLGLIQERRREEETLCAAAPAATPLLARLAEIYASFQAGAARSAALDALKGVYHGSTTLALAHAVHEATVETLKPDAEREATYRERNQSFLVKRLAKRLKAIVPKHEAALLRRAAGLGRAAGLIEERHEEALRAVAAAMEGGTLPPLASMTETQLAARLGAPPPADEGNADDPLLAAAAHWYSAHCAERDETKALLSERDQLLARLLELQQEHATGESFYPDANGCLRLSAGHVEGYTASDAVTHEPMTTVGGLIEKHEDHKLMRDESSATGGGDGGGAEDDEFACPQRLLDLVDSDPSYRETPNCLLYSTDTVGGNSGSPVLDADGKLVAINFDRQRQGLMNEYKWSPEYSRSIGTDVRYILWLVGTYDGANDLVEEMTTD